MSFTPVSSTGGGSTSGDVNLHDGLANAITSDARGTERPLAVEVIDAAGNQVVTFGGGAVTNAGTFAVQDSQVIADNAAFVDGTSKVFTAGYILDEVAGTALTENDAAAARIDSKRAVVGVLEDATTRGRRATVTANNALKVDNSAVNQPVTQVTSPWVVGGDVANDAGDSGNPVKIGGRASINEPTAVSASDRVNAWFNLNGRLATMPGSSQAGVDNIPNNPMGWMATDVGRAPGLVSLTGFNDATSLWDRVRVANGGRLQVDAVTSPGLTDAELRASAVVTNDPGLPNALGQAAMAASTSVAIASDQSAIPVSLASAPLPTDAATETTLEAVSATLITMLDGIAAMRDSLNDVALTAIIHREALAAA